MITASCNRLNLLRAISLPSVSRQTLSPRVVVLISDGWTVEPEVSREFSALLGGTKFVSIRNHRAAGAPGAWNTCLRYLAERGFNGFVAILDDDDEWDENHLAKNLHAAQDANANVVISGMRLLRDGVLLERAVPKDFTDRMFLVGNPGWQGSNTFVSMQAMKAVGGFRDGLASANDRDLAIRLLRLPGIRVAYTGEWTATWHLSSVRQVLSSPRSEAKLRGLRWFWQIYGSEMQPAEAEEFFARGHGYFGIRRDEILSSHDDRPPHCEPHGDLLC